MNRRQLIIGLGTVTSGVSLSFGTGAFTAGELSNRELKIAVTNDAQSLIGLVQNNEIAGVRLVGGELAIALEDTGVNVGSSYQFGAFVENNSTDWTDVVGLDPVMYGDTGFHPQNNFESAFMLRNNTSSDLSIKMTLEATDIDNDSEPKYVFQVHDENQQEGLIKSTGGTTTSMSSKNTPLPSGEACGVSFAINAMDSSIGDSLSGSISIEAGEIV